MLDLFIIILFFAVNILIGIVVSKNIKSLEHYSVGHRSFNSFVIFATLSATFIGGGYTIGNASKVFSMGMVYSFALLGFSLKEILVATLIAPRMGAHRDCITVGDIMQKRYGVVAKIITGVLSLFLCAGILGAQVGAMGAIFNTFFDLPAFWGIMIGFGIVIFYSTIGGMKAVVYTDVLQFLVLAIGVLATFFIGLHYIGGWHGLMTKVPHDKWNFLQNTDHIIFFIGLFVTFIFGETLVPPYVQRLFMAKTTKQTRRGTLASGLLSIPFFLIAGAIGLVAFALNPHIDANNALPYVVKNVLPIGVRGFVIASMLAIIMSSAAGFLNSASTAFVNDIVKPFYHHKLSERGLLNLARFSNLVVGVGSVIFALTISNVLDILLYAYNFQPYFDSFFEWRLQ